MAGGARWLHRRRQGRSRRTGIAFRHKPSMFWKWRARRERNPLLHRLAPVERAVTAAVAALGMLLVTGVVVATVLALVMASRMAAQQRTGHHQVTATVVRVSNPAAPPGTFVDTEGALPLREHLQWQWRGETHTGTTMMTGAGAGPDHKLIWVDNAGTLTSPPVRAGDAVAMAVISGLGAAVISVALLVAALRLRRSWLLSRRMQRWQDEWARVGPLWTGYSDRY